jgi:peroxidase
MRDSSNLILILGLGVLVVGGVACSAQRTIDGTNNHLADPAMGAKDSPLLRWADAHYADGDAALAGAGRESARAISNLVCDQEASIPNDHGASGMVWQWGQFLDHDIDLTEGVDPVETASIPVPLGDAWFDPFGTGTATIAFSRSAYVHGSHPREQVNQVTAWIDGSNVYGSDVLRASTLRANDGTGRLATSTGNLPPYNTTGLPNAGGSGPDLFLAGDVRANEQVYLTAMHTLWVREHNFWADRIRSFVPEASGDEIYEAARIVVIAELQIVTFKEFLPALLGRDAIAAYRGYDDRVDARIVNEFSTAAYRFGHSMLSPTLLRLDRRGRTIAEGNLPLRDAFFAPQLLVAEGGIDPLLRGLAKQKAENVDPYIVDDVRNFLFGPPGSGGFDLAALNIQRGRDHGLASYNDTREALGLARVSRFADISSDPQIQSRLASAYASVDAVDLWVGGLAEDHVAGALVGPVVRAILVDQFEALRDGDRFWYANALPRSLVGYFERSVRLSNIIRRNSGIGREIQDDVFHVRSPRVERRRRR